MNKLLVYDCEIVNAIPPNSEPVVAGVTYCKGWSDHADMGISVIGCYDAAGDAYRVFCRDNFDAFRSLVDDADVVCGFNSVGFDNKLIAAALGWEVPSAKCYDLLAEVWAAAGLSRVYGGRAHGGFGLDAVARANGLPGKTGNGALAPVLWQQGKIGEVIDYCLADVRLTWKLIEKVMRESALVCPKMGGLLDMAAPFSAVG